MIRTNIILNLVAISMFSSEIFAYSFQDAVNAIQSHEAVESIKSNALALEEAGDVKGSWGDPMFKIAAKNFPEETLKDDQSPMTGIEFGLSQKISLTTKYGNIEDAFNQLSKSKHLESENKKRELIKSFWTVIIDSRKLKEEIKIFEENKSWIAKILKVSKKLYSNGKISQQALLDIQIRNSEIESKLISKQFELKEQLDRLSYLLGFKDRLDESTVPWGLLEEKSEVKDLAELALKSKVQAKDHMLTASKQAYVPDLTFSLGYTKRSNIDNRGDFVSASVSFPLPFSSTKYSKHSQSVYEKSAASKKLRKYNRYKESEESRLRHEARKYAKELEILDTKTIKFSENSRKITSKSYGLGQSSYVELLQSELKLQKLLIQRSMLKAKLSKNQINLKYLIGEKVHE